MHKFYIFSLRPKTLYAEILQILFTLNSLLFIKQLHGEEILELL